MKAMHLAVAAALAAATQFGATTASAEISAASNFANRFISSLSEGVSSIRLFGGSADEDKTGLPAVGETFRLYEQAGDWFIFINDNSGTCLAEKFDANMNAVQFGRTADATGDTFLAVYAQLPEEYRRGRQKATLTVGDLSNTGKLSKRQRSGQAYTGAYVKSTSYDFITDAAYATSTVKMGPTEIETTLSLEGSAEALAATRACDAAQGV